MQYKILLLSGWTLLLTWAQYKLYCHMQQLRLQAKPVVLAPSHIKQIINRGSKLGHVVVIKNGNHATPDVFELVLDQLDKPTCQS